MNYKLLKETWVNNNIVENYKPKKFLGLITRCKDEFFVKEFTDYYLSQGVDTIYILDDNSNDKSIYDNITDNRVIIRYEKQIVHKDDWKGMKVVNNLYNKIRDNFEWIIFVDVDEFITTKKNFDKTIRDELKTTFKDFDYIRIPWVLMSSNLDKNPKSILDSIVYRRSQDIRHENITDDNHRKWECTYESILCKYIIRTNNISNLETHESTHFSIKQLPIIADGVKAQEIKVGTQDLKFHANLREKDIKDAYLICHHYRIISKENSINKVKNNKWYNRQQFDVDKIMKVYLPEVKDETLKIKKNKLNF